MRLLLDECVPRPLLRDRASHDAHHVVDVGWSAKRNGELLKLMLAERCEGLLTVDRSLTFQQNLRASGVGVVVLLMMGGVGYLIDCVGNALAPGFSESAVGSLVSLPAGLGEIGTCLWLLIAGVREPKRAPAHAT